MSGLVLNPKDRFSRDMAHPNVEALSSLCYRADPFVSWPKAPKIWFYLSRVMRKSAFCICENKDADQLCGNEAHL